MTELQALALLCLTSARRTRAYEQSLIIAETRAQGFEYLALRLLQGV